MGEDVLGEIKLIRMVNLEKKWYDLVCGRRFIFHIKQDHNPHNLLVNFNEEGLLIWMLELCYNV